jgi:hypothetical protein
MPVTTRSSTRSPPTSRSQHSYSLRENRPMPGHFANMEGHDDWEDVNTAAQALMMLSQTVSSPVRRSARIAARA